jgi:hypothetical protein
MDYKEEFFEEAAKVAEIEELKKKDNKTEGDNAVIAFFDKIYETAADEEEK